MNCESFCLAGGCLSSFGSGVLHALYLSFFYSLAAIVVSMGKFAPDVACTT